MREMNEMKTELKLEHIRQLSNSLVKCLDTLDQESKISLTTFGFTPVQQSYLIKYLTRIAKAADGSDVGYGKRRPKAEDRAWG